MHPSTAALDVDFYVFWAQAYGPTGIGVLYGKESHLRRCLHIKEAVI